MDFTAGSADASECTVKAGTISLVKDRNSFVDRLAIDIGGPAAACGHAVLPAGMAM